MNVKEKVALGSIAASAGLTAAKASSASDRLARNPVRGRPFADRLSATVLTFSRCRFPTSRPTPNINSATARSRASQRLPRPRCCSSSPPS